MRKADAVLLALVVVVSGCTAATESGEDVRENAPRVRVKGTVPYNVTRDAVLAALPTNVTPFEAVLSETVWLKASERVTILVEGKSGRGEPILSVLVVQNESAGKPTIQITGSQHGNEPAGTDATLLLMRLFAFGSESEVRPTLARVNLLFVPSANPDGRNSDERGNASGIDVNRDHMNLYSPEGRIVHSVFNDHRPAVILDLHEFGGLQFAPEGSPDDVHFEIGGPQNPLVHPEVGRASYDLEVAAQAAVNSEFGAGWAAIYPPTQSSQGSDIHRNHYAMHNAASLLFEADAGLGLGDGYKTRVKLHFVATMAVIEAVAADAGRFMTARATAGSEQENATLTGFIYEPQAYSAEFTDLLVGHGLEIFIPRGGVVGAGVTSDPTAEPYKLEWRPGSVIVNMSQESGRSAFEMFEVSNSVDTYYQAGPKDNGLVYYRAA